MNESGGPVKALATSTRSPPSGSSRSTTSWTSASARCAPSSAAATTATTGCKSMRSSLGTGDFYRVRVGIGRPAGPAGPGRLRALRLHRGRAQGAAAPGRPRRRRRGVARHGRPRAHPAALQQLSGTLPSGTTLGSPGELIPRCHVRLPRRRPDADDHELAAWAATEAGQLLVEVRAAGPEGGSSRTPVTRPRTSS